MGPVATTAWGILVGLILFLAMAVTSVIAVKPNDPGITAMPSAAAGSTGEEAPPADSKPASWSSLDLNGDGQLSLAEAAGYAEIVTRFERADRDRDGKLTRAEFQRLAKLPPAKAAGKAR
jgi:EF hand